jgi:uncharacterized protein YycO
MLLRFSLSKDLFGPVAAIGTLSHWGHVEIVYRGRYFGALPTGVDYRTFADAGEYWYEDFARVRTSDKALQEILSQKGKPYDFCAVSGLPLNRNWDNPEAWFCSELIAAGLNRDGWGIPHTGRVTPQNLWDLVTRKPVTIVTQGVTNS